MDAQSKALPSVARWLLLLISALCLSLPWLWENLLFLKPLGTASALLLVASGGRAGSFWGLWLMSSLSIAIAFHWSPAAMAYSLGSEYWLGLLVTIPFVLWDALRLTLGLWLAGKFTKRLDEIWLVSMGWTILLESFLPSVFPWIHGYPWLHFPFLVQAIDVFGPSWTTVIDFAMAGVTLVSCSLLWSNLSQRLSTPALISPVRKSYACLPFLLIVCNCIYSVYSERLWNERIDRSDTTRFGLVQIDPAYQESLGQMQSLSEEVAQQVDVVCWPESSGGTLDLKLCSLEDPKQTFQKSKEPLKGIRPWPNPTRELLLGGKNYCKSIESDESLFVTAMLIDPTERILARSNKRYLMPFGEFVPMAEHFPILEKFFDLQDKITPGTRPELFELGTGARVGVFLCYEDMIISAGRDLADAGATVLVSLINGSAFESRFTLEQHRLLAQSRAIENRRFLVRCASTGETCIISAVGEITARMPLDQKGVLIGVASHLHETTLYRLFPHLLDWLVVLAGSSSFALARRVGTSREKTLVPSG